MDPMNLPAKPEVCSFIRSWDNRVYSKNLGSPWIRPRSLFSQIFHGLLFEWTVWIYRPNLMSVALPVPEIIAITVLGWWGCDLRTPSLGEGESVGGRGWSRSKERWWVPIAHSNLSIFTRFRDIAAFVLQHATFRHATYSLPKVSPCSPGSRWMAFGLRRAKMLG